MIITVNGNEQELPEGTTVRQLIERHQLAPEKVAVELNCRLIRGSQYQTALEPGDQVEIVTFVGGG